MMRRARNEDRSWCGRIARLVVVGGIAGAAAMSGCHGGPGPLNVGGGGQAGDAAGQSGGTAEGGGQAGGGAGRSADARPDGAAGSGVADAGSDTGSCLAGMTFQNECTLACASGEVCWDYHKRDSMCIGTTCSIPCCDNQECARFAASKGAQFTSSAICGPDHLCVLVGTIGSFSCQ